jgi:hypothetical protein
LQSPPVCPEYTACCSDLSVQPPKSAWYMPLARKSRAINMVQRSSKVHKGETRRTHDQAAKYITWLA